MGRDVVRPRRYADSKGFEADPARPMYGPSVMPPQPDGVWQRPYNGGKWVTDTGENRHRRARYTHRKRTAPYPSLITFDSPSHEVSVARRVRTNTPHERLIHPFRGATTGSPTPRGR